MIRINGKNISAIFFNNKVIAAVYTASGKVWEAIRSCFGSGIWREVKGWSDTDKWKEN